ncbi:hypothetical protein N8D56_16365 [Devosia sp. A8/3-2]|nr:hypothetical protein N8D56_16365 [Devosia sp. A8/3-2]
MRPIKTALLSAMAAPAPVSAPMAQEAAPYRPGPETSGTIKVWTGPIMTAPSER